MLPVLIYIQEFNWRAKQVNHTTSRTQRRTEVCNLTHDTNTNPIADDYSENQTELWMDTDVIEHTSKKHREKPFWDSREETLFERPMSRNFSRSPGQI